MAGKTRLELVGVDDLIKRLDKAGGNIEHLILAAARAGAKKPSEDMQRYMDSHRRTGTTASSFTVKEDVKDGVVTYEAGFSVRKGGLPAIFLNLGTPRITPSFFVERAVENNIDEIRRLQQEALREAFGGMV